MHRTGDRVQLAVCSSILSVEFPIQIHSLTCRSVIFHHYSLISLCEDIFGFCERGLQLQQGIEYLLPQLNSQIRALPVITKNVFGLSSIRFASQKLRKTFVVLSTFTCLFLLLLFFFFSFFLFFSWEGYRFLIQKFNNWQVVSAVEYWNQQIIENWNWPVWNIDVQNHGGNLSNCHCHSCLCLYSCLWTNHEQCHGFQFQT